MVRVLAAVYRLLVRMGDGLIAVFGPRGLLWAEDSIDGRYLRSLCYLVFFAVLFVLFGLLLRLL